jgi:transcriptional regulator with XRE-family HTH domain
MTFFTRVWQDDGEGWPRLVGTTYQALAGVPRICYPEFDMSNLIRRTEAAALCEVSASSAKSLQRAEIHPEQGTHSDGGAVLSREPAGPVRRKAVELSAFFERLRQVLADRGLSQADLARELNVGVATVSEWFTRGRVPNGDVMLRLPGALRVNGHWLLTGEGPREHETTPHGDPYQRGAQDALSRVSDALDEARRRFAPARATAGDSRDAG